MVLKAQTLALRFVGLRADDVFGARVGRVDAVLVDRENGTVQWLLVRIAGLGGGFMVVPLRDLTAGAGHLHLPFERSKLLAAPRVPESGALTSKLERQLCDFYGISTATRGATVSAWERRATSARLVSPGEWNPPSRGRIVPGEEQPKAREQTAPTVARAPAPAPTPLAGQPGLPPRPRRPTR